MTPAEINKPLHLFIYIGGAVVVDKIISKTNHMQISFCFPASYFLPSCCYTQLETPSEVAIAVRMLIAI
jgi:hypothetical protein